MKRILLTVEYDGTAYAGWQRQINGLAVQQVLEEALSSACGHPVTVTVRTRECTRWTRKFILTQTVRSRRISIPLC